MSNTQTEEIRPEQQSQQHDPSGRQNGVRCNWLVRSRSDRERQWTVTRDEHNRWSCGCPDWIFRRRDCYHISQIKTGASVDYTSIPVGDPQETVPSRRDVETSCPDQPERSTKPHSTLFAIIRRCMKAKEKKQAKETLDSLRFIQSHKRDWNITPNRETGGYDGPDFRIVPEKDQIVEVRNSVRGDDVSCFRFREIAGLAEKICQLAKEISQGGKYTATVRGLNSLEIRNGGMESYTIIGNKIYLKGKRGGLVKLKDSMRTGIRELFQMLRIPVICPCGMSHYLWGIEIEFDAPGYSQLTSKALTDYSISFQPIGRDGGGQGEARSIPDNDFRKAMESVITSYRQALKIVTDSKSEIEPLSKIIRQLEKAAKACKNVHLNKETLNEIVRDFGDGKSPNGIHIHGPKSDYLLEAMQVVALWWNQRSPQAKEMLNKRLEHGYGELDAVRKSGVCRKGNYSEYRQLNSDTPDNIETFLFPVLLAITTDRPELPEISAMKYDNLTAFHQAEAFCLQFIPKAENSACNAIGEDLFSLEEVRHV